ncbi:proton channel OtopLc-like isoform X2 [Euwallacea similis]|uniref:proton channel OtopLc-like isoform X2 n=1 Tax=Euwallacea similis TaxID=1736056 RepID=UPI00344C8550
MMREEQLIGATTELNSQGGSPSESNKVTFAFDTRALPLVPKDTPDNTVNEGKQVNDDIKLPKQSSDMLPLSSPLEQDNVSLAMSEGVLRHPNPNKPKNAVPGLIHSSSTSDFLRLRNANRDRIPRSMILPSTQNPGHFNSIRLNTYSFDGSQVADSALEISNPNLTNFATAEEQFSPSPSIPGVGRGFNEAFIYSNGGSYASQNGTSKMVVLPSVASSLSSHHHSKPTPTEVKKKIFTDILTTSMSTIYAILIVTLGVSFYIIDFLELENEELNFIAEGFSLALLSVALLYLLFLCIDITIYNRRKAKFEKLKETVESEDLEFMNLSKKVDHTYCFNMDRHSSNFYLKIGAAVFCFGHLIHSILILTYRGIIMNSEDQTSAECMSVVTFIIEILYPIYSVTLLFFIFKYSNVIINKNRDFHRFGFMHCVASSLCFWLWTIFRETAEYIQNSQYPDEYANSTEGDTIQLNENYVKVKSIVPYRFTAMCEHEELNVIYQNYSPYLYPFSVEYSILVVGILYIVFMNIGLCRPIEHDHDDHIHEEDTRHCRNERRPSEHESNITIHADCHASNKGLFLGFIVLVFSMVSLILFFITYSSERSSLAEIGLQVNQSTRLAIMALMIMAVAFAYFQMIKLDVNEVAHNSLDNFLCLMCLPAIFVHGIFSIIAGIIYRNGLAVSTVVLEVIQVVIQTAFIIDGMARSSNTKTLRKKKPGREFVIFLVICNVAMWILQTFEVKSHGLDNYRQEFYSRELWSIIGHMCLPLMMFYRFHSSVCIVDIWKYAYVPSGH